MEAPENILVETPFRVTDLKQWVYCPRILYFELCLPEVRPTTYKMEAGREAGRAEVSREIRRSLLKYGVLEGERKFEVELASSHYGLRGKVDLIILGRDEVIPVDYKLSRVAGDHFKMQLMAYGLLLEEATGLPARRGYLYLLPEKCREEVKFRAELRQKVLRALDEMHAMLYREIMPEPVLNRKKCLGCEFRRFCNDVI